MSADVDTEEIMPLTSLENGASAIAKHTNLGSKQAREDLLRMKWECENEDRWRMSDE